MAALRQATPPRKGVVRPRATEWVPGHRWNRWKWVPTLSVATIDNGLTERLFRRVAIMRRNALFVGSHDGGRRAATLFSLLGTSELIGLDPVAYLADVLPRLARGITIATDLPELMPAAWLARHPEARVPPLNVPRLTEFADD